LVCELEVTRSAAQLTKARKVGQVNLDGNQEELTKTEKEALNKELKMTTESNSQKW
jgi:hypothetical protein